MNFSLVCWIFQSVLVELKGESKWINPSPPLLIIYSRTTQKVGGVGSIGRGAYQGDWTTTIKFHWSYYYWSWSRTVMDDRIGKKRKWTRDRTSSIIRYEDLATWPKTKALHPKLSTFSKGGRTGANTASLLSFQEFLSFIFSLLLLILCSLPSQYLLTREMDASREAHARGDWKKGSFADRSKIF